MIVPDHQRYVWCSVDGYVVDAEFVQGLSFLVGLKDEYVVWHLFEFNSLLLRGRVETVNLLEVYIIDDYV